MKIAAVIVTYNRKELLEEVLEAFDAQTKLPDYMIVVDNACTDGTHNVLEKWKNRDIGNEKFVIRSDINLGGSGGFYLGTKCAMETEAEWVWVSDDDAIPELNVFEKAETHIKGIKNTNDVSAICTAVFTDGKISETNRCYRKKTFGRVRLIPIPTKKYENSKFLCDNFSYVGVMMNKRSLKECGLIRPDFFIWRDDVEHSWRLSLIGKIVCFPDMKIVHKMKHQDYQGISWKTYYGYRNDIIVLNEFCSLRYAVVKAASAIIHGIRSGKKRHLRLCLDAVIAGFNKEKGPNEKYMPNTWRY